MLVDAGGTDRTFKIRDRASRSGVRKQVWHYPSRNECMFCHSRAAGFVLGLTTPQMNRTHKYGEIADNQIRTFAHIGLFKNPPVKEPAAYRAYPDPFGRAANLNARARTYLQVNCSICHVVDGGGNSLIDLAYTTTLSKTHTLNAPPIHETYGIAAARLIAPGDPQRSVLYHRMSVRGEGQMPPPAPIEHLARRDLPFKGCIASTSASFLKKSSMQIRSYLPGDELAQRLSRLAGAIDRSLSRQTVSTTMFKEYLTIA